MGRPFASVLIANRGEIAVRIIKACRAEKLRAIAIYSDVDAGALHVRQADEAHRIGPPPAPESYLNVAAILEAARRSGAEAIHPGYGFLAENADFAERVQQAGLVWIGPPPGAMRLLGDKSAAKGLAERVGVPTLPGYHGDAQDDATLVAEAERIGFPLLVKAAAGGGGRGMRIVRAADELTEALASARREAQAGFGDDRLLLERYLERPRHVEMQVFGDEHGNVIYLGERDCSVQRRHQKVIEEAPAPHFSEAQRRAMGEASVALARAAGYTNAGTCEFLLDRDGRFYFLEMNTRLQVEHPVTEMVTGLDLVRLQFTVAAGDPLPIAQEAVRIRGHAVECRLYAEDPTTGFLPSSGLLEEFSTPDTGYPDPADEDEPLRVDAGVEMGDRVTPYYDPLLAKVIVGAPDREAALDCLSWVLPAIHVRGVVTNLRFLQAVIESQQFGSGRVHTGLVDELGLGRGPILPADDLLAAAALYLTQHDRQRLAPSRTPSGVEVWHQVGPWRQGWVGVRVTFIHDGILLNVGLNRPVARDEPWEFEVNGRRFERRISIENDGRITLERGAGLEHIQQIWRDGARMGVRVGRAGALLTLADGSAIDQSSTGAERGAPHDLVCAPMPGRIVKVAVSEGEHVTTNQTLVVLEAMKIEHLVAAPRDGVVEAIRCKEGDQVELGAELVELEEE